MLNTPDNNRLRYTEYVCEKCGHYFLDAPGDEKVKCNRLYCDGLAYSNGDLTAYTRPIIDE